jgi:ubiquinone/menaquinone biosynthesis C-methylase UbiE
MSLSDRRKYILKDKEDEELFRLEFQHQVWLEETITACRKAGFGSGQTLLDLGCGPGYLSYDLCKIAGPDGRIIAVDNSRKFIDRIQAKIAEEEHRNITAKLCDIQHLELETNSIDGVIARWVMMFLPEVESVLDKIVRVLKPNGIIVVMDYFHFRTMSLWPKKESFEKVYHAVYQLIKRHGGNADTGGFMPQLLSQKGFKIVDIYPIFRIGRPGSSLWEWLEMTAKNHNNLVDAGIITPEELQEYYDDWSESSKNPNAFFTAPPVLITIGKKI